MLRTVGSRWKVRAARLLCTVGIALIAFSLFRVSRALLSSTPGTPIASGNGPSLVAPADERPVTLVIASIDLATRVVPATLNHGSWQVPGFAAGYLEGTGRPGRQGNMVIAAHDDIQGAVFRRLKDVRAGDVITVSAAQGHFRYTVDQILHAEPDESWLMAPTASQRLTLITCWPDFFTWEAGYNSQRLAVRASLSTPIDSSG